MPKMQQNTFGSWAPARPAGAVYALPKRSGGPASKWRERMGRRIEGTEPTYKGREATGEGLLLRRTGGKGGERG